MLEIQLQIGCVQTIKNDIAISPLTLLVQHYLKQKSSLKTMDLRGFRCIWVQSIDLHLIKIFSTSYIPQFFQFLTSLIPSTIPYMICRCNMCQPHDSIIVHGIGDQNKNDSHHPLTFESDQYPSLKILEISTSPIFPSLISHPLKKI